MGRRSNKKTWTGSYSNELMEGIGRFLPRKGLPLIVDDQRVRWTPRFLAVASVLMSWASGATLHERFQASRECLIGMYDSRRRPGRSYQGFISGMVRQSAGLLAVIVPALQKAVIKMAGSHWRIGKWAPLGVDGSRVECPMTEANEKAFGCAGKKKTTPQQYLTVAFHGFFSNYWGADQSRRSEPRP